MPDAQILNTPSGRNCPKCASRTVWRKGKYSTFHGCPKWPGCDGKIGAPRGASAKAEGQEAKQEEGQGQEETPKEAPKPEEKPAEKAATEAKAQEGLGAALWPALQPIVNAEIDRRAGAIAQEMIAKSGGTSVIHEWVDQSGIIHAEIEGGHALAPALLKRIQIMRKKNFMLVGPAGCGKTTLACDVAKALSMEFATVSCSAGMPEWHLTGRSMPNLQTGESVYTDSAFVRMYRGGGVFLIDEVDAADANVLIVINAATANGHWDVPGLGRIARHPNFILLAAANTYGRGADRIYVGRNALDGAFLNRFSGRVFDMDYDRDLEAKLYPNPTVLAAVWKIRERVGELKIRQIVGTRDVESAYDMVTGGMTLKEALAAIAVPFTPDERSKVGVA